MLSRPESWKYGRPKEPLGPMRGFVGMDQWIMAKPLPMGFFDLDPAGAARKLKQMPVQLETLDLAGRVLDEWSHQRNWVIEATNPERHLVIVNEEIDREPPENTRTFVIDYQTKKVVRDWPREGGPFGKSYFAESGKTLCSADVNGRDSRWTQCFDIDSGTKIAEYTGFKGGEPADITTHASRIVLSHIDLIRGINEEFDKDLYKDRVIWDFRATKEVAEWVPAMQISESYFNGAVKKVTAWGPFAISATGRYLAEGTNGILRIYEVP